MAEAKRLTEAARARLQAAKAARAGRTTLKGYDAYGFSAVLDEIMAGNPATELPERYDDLFLPRKISSSLEEDCLDAPLATCGYNFRRDEPTESRRKCRFGRLKLSNPYQDEMLRRADGFAQARVPIEASAWVGGATVRKPYDLYPARMLVRLLWNLWPGRLVVTTKRERAGGAGESRLDDREFRAAMAKYLVGYTREFARFHVAAGARVLLIGRAVTSRYDVATGTEMQVKDRDVWNNVTLQDSGESEVMLSPGGYGVPRWRLA